MSSTDKISHIGTLHNRSVVKNPLPCRQLLITVLHATLVYVCTIYTRPLSVYPWHSRSFRNSCYNACLLAQMIVCLNATKFKPHIFCVSQCQVVATDIGQCLSSHVTLLITSRLYTFCHFLSFRFWGQNFRKWMLLLWHQHISC